MTTIAYKAGVLAGDTLIIDDDTIDPGVVRKVFRLENGTLIGFSGSRPAIQLAMRELKKHTDKLTAMQSAGGAIEAIVVSTDGAVRQLEESGWTETGAPYYAIGSGKQAALVAMRCGKSAKQAVRIAMDFDPHTGGKVQSVKLK